MKNTNIKPYVRQFYKHNTLCFLTALSLTLVIPVFELSVSRLLQLLTDLTAGNQPQYSLRRLLLYAIVSLIGNSAFYYLTSYFKPRFVTRALAQYKEYIFHQLTQKNISAFTNENTATYISALTNDMQSIEQGYLWNPFTIIQQLLTGIGALLLMFWYSPVLTFISMGLALPSLILSLLTGSKMARTEKLVSDQNEVYTAAIKDSLDGFSVIKSFKAEAALFRIFKDTIRKLTDVQYRKYHLQHLLDVLSGFTWVVAQFGVFLIGAWLALSGRSITAGTLIIFVQLMNYVLNPLRVIPACIAQHKAARTLLEKTAAALESNLREETPSSPVTLQQEIIVSDISFAYESGKPVLKNIRYTFEPGRKYAIVGASGSGKSTLLNLLMASSSDYTGSICYGNRELRTIHSEDLYEIQSLIQQNVFIFNATIKDNITLFQSWPEEEIDRAIRLSGLSALIREKGADYLCGENGSGLSGGEKQRIAIARSLLKQSKILLVDEATSALDAETAYQVSNAILSLDHITAIIVTHSLDENLLKQYDAILTLKNGQLVEAGTFDELLAQKKYFYSLYTVSQ